MLSQVRLRPHEVPDWPKLAWVASCAEGSGDVDVLHGPRVEARGEWCVEAAWDGPFAQGSEVWFEEGNDYVVTLRVKRSGTEWYSEDFGAPFLGRFTWKHGEARDLQLLPLEPDQLRNESARGQAFESLHQD